MGLMFMLLFQVFRLYYAAIVHCILHTTDCKIDFSCTAQCGNKMSCDSNFRELIGSDHLAKNV